MDIELYVFSAHARCCGLNKDGGLVDLFVNIQLLENSFIARTEELKNCIWAVGRLSERRYTSCLNQRWNIHDVYGLVIYRERNSHQAITASDSPDPARNNDRMRRFFAPTICC